MSFANHVPPAPAPEPAPLPFEPLRPQGSFNQDPAAQGFDQFSGNQPNVQQQPAGQPDPNDLMAQIMAGLQQQNLRPAPGQTQLPYGTAGAGPTPPQLPIPAAAPSYDPNLLNEPVVAERLRNLELTYGNAYQQTQDQTVRQAILLAYHGEKAQLEARVEQARTARDRDALAQQQQQHSSLLEPVFRLLAAQVLAKELGIQDINRILNDPAGNPIWDARTMQINAMYQATAFAQGNIQQSAGRAIAPVPTGGGAGTDITSFTRTASREDFLRAVDQAKRTGIRVLSG
jgi:hypothetical protein